MTDPHAENKRLYALDEAAVGPEEAPNRWQIQDTDGDWHNKIAIPCWAINTKYRRDPEAPPLPSLDWHEAPDWANWHYKHPTRGSMWFRREPLEIDSGYEPRPRPQWFELTRPDYEAWNHVMDEQKSDEYLTGPALHRAIADAMEAGEGPGSFQIKNKHGNFFDPELWDTLVHADLHSELIRRKPRMRHLIDAEGNRWEWPEPLQHEPSEGKKYFYPDITDARPSCYSACWKGSWWDNARLNRGFCFLDDDACMDLSRALIAASGGSCD